MMASQDTSASAWTTRVLVIDDSKTVVGFVQKALGEKYKVETLESFIAIRGYIEETPPHLIILDLNIPAFSGLSFGQLIRSHQRRSIPMIIFSSQPKEELQQAARAVNACQYISKVGCTAETFSRTVNRVLASASLRAVLEAGER